MKQVYILSLIILMLASCTTGKKMTHEEMMAGAPAWVRKTPNEPQYYHGIGSASKSTQMDYREKARQNALSDMAANISVNISSSSVLNQFESDHKFSEYFMDNIRLSTKNYLEGYELVDSWESTDRFWIYFRLSKADYERIKSERIRTALSKAQGDCGEAEKSLSAANSAGAIYNYIKAIEKIKDFLGEDLTVETSGKRLSFTGKLFADLTTALQNIRVVFPVNTIEVKRGQKSATEEIISVVTNENKVSQTGIPVITRYSWFPGKKDEQVSDALGKIRIKTGSINSRLKTENISAVVNLDKMVNETTQDPVVRKLLSNIRVTEFVLPVSIAPSVFYVDVLEKNMDQIVPGSRMLQDITGRLINDGFALATMPGDADYVLSVTANTMKNSERNAKFSASLVADFMVKDKTGHLIYNQHIADITGLGGSYDEAGTDAFNALTSRIRISLLPAFYKVLFSE